MKSMVCLTYVGLSGLQVVLGGVRKIGQQWWGLNASVNFVNDREESDEEEELFAGPGQEGISLWDSLGEGFLREASQLGMSF